MRSASEILLAPFCAPLNCWRMASSAASTRARRARLIDGPVLLRRQADARTVGTLPRLSLLRKVEAEAQAVDTSSDTLSPDANT